MTIAGFKTGAPVAGARGLLRAAALLVVACLSVASALAVEKAQLLVTQESGFARLVLDFPDRLDLPAYNLRSENGVLAIEFSDPIELVLPDVGATLPDYISVARVDPDGKGVRFGLRTTLNFNRMEAGEKLFVDLLPLNWQGLPPGLPPEIVEQLARRGAEAAKLAEQRRKAEEARLIRPRAKVRVGRNPTFMRLQFDWSADTHAEFKLINGVAELVFDWPVPIDLFHLSADLPEEILGVTNAVAPEGSRVTLRLARGVVPRFYAVDRRQFILDFDIAAVAPAALSGLPLRAIVPPPAEVASPSEDVAATVPEAGSAVVRPFVNQLGATVRVVFPFDKETPSAVFRRGDTVWMLFDTLASIELPSANQALSAITSSVNVITAGDTQIVRFDLTGRRLATLGSEGKTWVLTLGDLLLAPTLPLPINRRLDAAGLYEVVADLDRPGKVHEFRDPVVGDLLQVVTAYPPARGVARAFEFVDFTALSSAQGLVIKPQHDGVEVKVETRLAVVRGEGGLILSSAGTPRALDLRDDKGKRAGFIDLAAYLIADPSDLDIRRTALMNQAAAAEGPQRDRARLELARFYLANRFGIEALGVLRVLENDLRSRELRPTVVLGQAIGSTLSGRPRDALQVLNSPAQAGLIDALMWRTVARAEIGDFEGARLDAMASEGVLEAYPIWVRNLFLMAAIRASVESDDVQLADRYLAMVDAAALSTDQAMLLRVLSGRIDEADNRMEEALQAYGEAIASDIRPARAEAVYRTLKLLDRRGDLDIAKGTQALVAESMLWRGNALEADMLKLLAELQFRQGEYRLGFETVRAAVSSYPDSAPITQLLDAAQHVFTDLYLNGRADKMEPLEALSVYYDFRQMTPPGARGDEMIRNLARRLVKVDLLSQAADLLEYQIDSRLKGVAQAQIAADLAVIEIADRDPKAALRTLSKTRIADLSPTLERQRRVLEARALIDAGRQELALDMLAALKGRDVELLRIDAHWQARRYGQAAGLLEALYASGDEILSQAERMNLVKAGVGFVLANDSIGLSRLRAKFSDRLAQSTEWAMFDFVTSDTTPSSAEFKQVAREIAGLDSLNAFLASYSAMYGQEGALAPLSASRKDAFTGA